jgi:hypothetical protein
MKPLPLEFTHHGRTLKQLARSATVAIYELVGSQGLTYGSELLRIKRKPEQLLFSKVLPEREVYPSDSEFGRIAWSYNSQQRRQAFERYDVLLSETLKRPVDRRSTVLVHAEHQNLHVHKPTAFQRALMKEQSRCN